MNEKIYYTPDELAELFRVHVNTIYNQIKTGKIKAIRIGDQWRIETSEVSQIQKTHQE